MLNSKCANDNKSVHLPPAAGNYRGALNRKMEVEVKITPVTQAVDVYRLPARFLGKSSRLTIHGSFSI